MASPIPNDAQDVFISYSSHDVTQVRDLAEVLRTAGVRLWRDGDRLLGGDFYNAKIVEATKPSKGVALTCSPNALPSDNVHQELMAPWDPHTPCILPLRRPRPRAT